MKKATEILIKALENRLEAEVKMKEALEEISGLLEVTEYAHLINAVGEQLVWMFAISKFFCDYDENASPLKKISVEFFNPIFGTPTKIFLYLKMFHIDNSEFHVAELG